MKSTLKYIALTALPLGILIAVMYYYAVDIPSGDEWALVPYIKKLYDGTLTLADVFAQHNEHRIFWAKIIMLLNAFYFGWNMYLELAVNVIFAIGSSVVIYSEIEKLPLTGAKRGLLYFMSAFLIFSITQQHNFLWGFQMQIFMSVFFCLASIKLIASGRVYLALIPALFATYSFANGMLIWPAGIILLWLKDKKPVNTSIIIWLMSGMAGILLYFWNYNYGTWQASVLDRVIFFVTHPHVPVILFATYLGAPLANYRQSIALGMGLWGIMLQAWCLVRLAKAGRVNIFWLGVDVYVLLTAAVTVYGRSQTISTAMALRYISISMLFWIVTGCLLAVTLERERKLPLKYYVIAALLVISVSASEHALIRARQSSERQGILKEHLLEGRYDDRVFHESMFECKHDYELIKTLREHGIRNFTNAPDVKFSDFRRTEYAGSESKGLSAELERIEYPHEGFMIIKGWWKIDGLDKNSQQTSRTFLILSGGQSYQAELHAPIEKERLDAKKYPDPYDIYHRKNFFGDLFYGDIPEGKYHAVLKVITPQGHEYYLELDQTIFNGIMSE